MVCRAVTMGSFSSPDVRFGHNGP